jgi:hypothetical protein
VYSVLNLISLYHDSVLHRAASSLPAPLRPPSSSHTRYTRHFVTNSQPYNILAHTLSVVQSLELLIEMAVTKRGGGRDKAEKTVIAIEAIKAALRLGLMGATKGRTGVQPPVAEREMDPALLAMNQERLAKMQRAATKLHHGTEATAAPPPHSAADVLLRQSHGETSLQIGMAKVETEREDEPEFWTGPRTGYVRPTLASLRRNGDATPLGDATVTLTASYMAKDVGKEYLMSRVLTVEDVRRPEDLVSKAKGIKKLAEIIYILRPLIYGTCVPLGPRAVAAQLAFHSSVVGTNCKLTADCYCSHDDSDRDAQVRPPPHAPVPPLPRARVPRLLAPVFVDVATRDEQGFGTDVARQDRDRTGEARDEQEGEAVLVVPRSGTGVGGLDKVRSCLSFSLSYEKRN